MNRLHPEAAVALGIWMFWKSGLHKRYAQKCRWWKCQKDFINRSTRVPERYCCRKHRQNAQKKAFDARARVWKELDPRPGDREQLRLLTRV